MFNKTELQEPTVRKATAKEVQYYNALIEKERKKLQSYKKLNIGRHTTKVAFK